MLKINALLFLFIVQFFLISTGISIYLFIRHRKLSTKFTISQGEIRRLGSEINKQEEEIGALSAWPKMYEETRQKLEQIQGINGKLIQTVESLVPEAQRSKEFEQMITEIGQHNKELNTCIGTLEKENASLEKSLQSSQREADDLSSKLQQSVKKEEFDRVMSEKKGLEIKIERLQEELKTKTKEIEQIEKNYIYLEKEYNALYKNIKGEEPPGS